jgi:hypothetical protein
MGYRSCGGEAWKKLKKRGDSEGTGNVGERAIFEVERHLFVLYCILSSRKWEGAGER